MFPSASSRTFGNRVLLRLLLAMFLVPAASAAWSAEPVPLPQTSPWDLTRLQTPPKYQWGETKGAVRELYYENEPYHGQPTRVFAYYAQPEKGSGPFPAMLLVHGGGGQAFAEWATLWAQRGYAALAMDLAGCGPDRQRLTDGGPGQGDEDKFHEFTEATAGDMWTYHAVAAVLRGHSLLASLPDVDRNRIGVTGISWGGYLTCIIAGVDNRLKVAVPVYGCGFLQEDSAWVAILEQMGTALGDRWIKYFDPSQYLPGVRCPILFVNGTNDFAYPLGSYQKSYRLVPGDRHLCITVRMPHSHPDGWKPVEIGLFVDSVLLGGAPLPRISVMKLEAAAIQATFESPTPVVEAELNYTTDSGPWQKRNWLSQPAKIDGGTVRADLPAQRPLVCFLTIRDNRGAVVSAEHAELTPP